MLNDVPGSCWQASIWVDREQVVVYGPTLKGLRMNAVHALMGRGRETFTRFENLPPDNNYASPHTYYVYFLFEAGVPPAVDALALLKRYGYKEPNAEERPGWYRATDGKPGPRDAGGMLPLYVPNLYKEADWFAEHALVPEKGPGYVDEFASLDTLPLHRMQTVKRVIGEEDANEMVARGWYILAIEPRGEVEREHGEVVGATTAFTMGHPEPKAK